MSYCTLSWAICTSLITFTPVQCFAPPPSDKSRTPWRRRAHTHLPVEDEKKRASEGMAREMIPSLRQSIAARMPGNKLFRGTHQPAGQGKAIHVVRQAGSPISTYLYLPISHLPLTPLPTYPYISTDPPTAWLPTSLPPSLPPCLPTCLPTYLPTYLPIQTHAYILTEAHTSHCIATLLYFTLLASRDSTLHSVASRYVVLYVMLPNNKCMHACIHACMHTYIHTYISFLADETKGSFALRVVSRRYSVRCLNGHTTKSGHNDHQLHYPSRTPNLILRDDLLATIPDGASVGILAMSAEMHSLAVQASSSNHSGSPLSIQT